MFKRKPKEKLITVVHHKEFNNDVLAYEYYLIILGGYGNTLRLTVEQFKELQQELNKDASISNTTTK